MNRWIESTQLLASLEGKRPDCLDFPGEGWNDADRADALDYVGGSRNREHFSRLVMAKIRQSGTLKKHVRADLLIRWSQVQSEPAEFREFFDNFDPGYGTFELWWLACLCDRIRIR